jgi:integrase
VIQRVGRGKKARQQSSDLQELLDIAWGTGRRVSAILSLKYADLRLTDNPPAIVWPRDTDKTGREFCAAINSTVRAAINRIRADRLLRIESEYLFPHPLDPKKPL